MTIKNNICLLFVLFFCCQKIYAQCGSGTPSFTANLSSAPNATWVSPSVQRNDTCCGWTGSDQCIKFTIFLNPNSMGINFGIASGAVPNGALFYSINCGPPISVGTPICLSGAGPHILTFCKPGNNQNTYSISAIPSPVVPDSIMVRNGCTQTLAVSGFSVPTITWTSVNPGPNGTYNSYLNCTSGCATVQVTPTGTPPPFVDYQVSGYGQSPCQANLYTDTVRVYFYTDLLAGINPTLSTICFGSTNAVLTATASGGLPPYTYSWSPGGSTGTVVTVGPGTYTVFVGDNTGCPPTTATAVVNQYTLPISANAGPDKTVCKSSPTVALSGTVTNASGGVWSGGSGTFAPSTTSLNTNYIATAGELSTGVQLYLTTTGNSGCPPKKDTINISFQNIPVANAGPDFTLCANNNIVALNGNVSGFSSTGQWSSTAGAFSSTTNVSTTYTAPATTGTFNVILTSTGNGVCPAAKDTAKIIVTPSPTVNAGPDQTVCSNSSASLSGSVTGATSTGIWSTLGDGSFSPIATQLNASYVPGPNDISTGAVSLILTSTGNGNCFAVKDTMKIVIKKVAVVSAGSSQTVCSSSGSVALSGSVTGGVTSGNWTTSGTGAFNPTSSSLTPSYLFSAADINAASVTFTLTSAANNPCPVVTATTSLVIVKIATVNAGPNQSLCSNSPTIGLSGSVLNNNTGSWSTSAAGSFNPGNNSLVTAYNITPSDVVAGSVIFTLTSTNNGPCPAVTDTVKMTIIKSPTVLAGPNQSICATTGSITLNGGIFGGTGNAGLWTTSGTGMFNPSANQLNTQYFISAGDVSAGVVTFTLTSQNNGPCPAGSASMSLQVTPLATVNAGPNQFLCSNAGSVTLNGTINGVGTGTWSSSSTGAFSPGISSLNPSVAFTSSDISSGAMTFTLTSTNNGLCPAVSDSVKITIAKIATVNAGPNQTICSSTPSVNLNGSVNGVTSTGYWATGGSGAFNPAFTSLNTTYFVSVQDLAAGAVSFTLTSSNNGPCPSVTDTMNVSIVPVAAVNAGPNQYVCSITPTIALTGIVNSNTNGGMWSGSGGGTFIPGNTSLNTTYSMTPSDASNGSVTFTLTATGNAPCAAVTDTVKIKIKVPAQVNAGPDLMMCSNSAAIALAGTVSAGSNTGIWNTNGSGSFSPSNNALNASYNVSSADINNGSILLILTSTNNDVCPADSDTTKLTIIKKPVINPLKDTVICAYQNPLKVVATVSGGSGSYVWSTSGSGTFAFAGGLNAVNYSLSASDIAAGFVKLTITSVLNGPCGDYSTGINVVINPAPNADFIASTYTANIPNDPIQFTNQSSGANSYYWNFGDGGFTNLVNPIHNYVTVGFYTVSLVATNQFGCKDTAYRDIKVISDIQFPNVFTPNLNGPNGGSYNVNDYSNDVFFPYTSGVTDYHLRIFNRWGELIFESREISIGWDGYFNGKLCQQDAYVWKADVKFFDGRKYNKTGNVTLLR